MVFFVFSLFEISSLKITYVRSVEKPKITEKSKNKQKTSDSPARKTQKKSEKHRKNVKFGPFCHKFEIVIYGRRGKKRAEKTKLQKLQKFLKIILSEKFSKKHYPEKTHH